MTPVIQFNNVTKRFGAHTAMDGISFEVPSGVVFALLGDNGAGKTTSIKTMLGLSRPDSGTASVLGYDCQTQNLEIRRRVGFVPEQPTLYEWMRVDEFGWFAAGFHARGFLERYRSLIEDFEISPDKKIKSLSKGMRAKVSLAAALGHDPDLLILDEPTSGLDPMIRREFLESMVDRAAAGKTVFLSSHQINEVERVADYVAMMRQGELLMVQRVEDLKSRVRAMHLTVSESGVPVPQIGVDIVQAKRFGRQWHLLVRDLTGRASCCGERA